MILNTKTQKLFLEFICSLYTLLFVYAAVSKLLDFENFQVQLGQSPLLSAFAWWIARLVPFMELGIVVLLSVPKWRNLGLFGALILMTLFTAYIFIVLHFSAFVPCSCGGILEKMSWNTHLIFNLVFVILAVLALVWQDQISTEKFQFQIKWPLLKSIPIAIVSSAIFMVVLFLSSEDIMQHENPFIRRYPQHPVMQINSTNLKYNSYYFAGATNRKIYLGNYSNPLHLIAMDSTLNHPEDIKISFDPKKIPFKMVTIAVRDSYFYLMDGSVPIIFRGNTANWKITKELRGMPYFARAEPVDSSTILFKSNNGKNLSNILGVFSAEQSPKIKYNKALLQQQIDGVFDTDGQLMYNQELNKMVYLYFYRNEFTVADKNAALIYRGHTIDTNAHAKIKVSYLKNGTERKMSAPPFVVNAHAAIRGHLLFVHSTVKGHYENPKLWKEAFIIDVYDLNKKGYLLSFALYGIKEEKLNSFFVTPTHLYAIIGNTLVVCELRGLLKKEMKSVGTKNF